MLPDLGPPTLEVLGVSYLSAMIIPVNRSRDIYIYIYIYTHISMITNNPFTLLFGTYLRCESHIL